MSIIEKINVGGTDYDVADAQSRLNIEDLKNNSGETNNLTTEDKTLVGAINELDSDVDELVTTIGDATTLTTTDKTVVGAVNELNVKMSDPIKSVALTLPSTTFTANTQSETTSDVSSVVPSGYKAITAIPRHSMSAQLCWTVCVYSTGTGTVTVRLRNLSSTDVTVAPVVDVLCVKK